MPTITYEDFAKLEIKIGTIKTAEVVEGADRLLRLTVDVGEEELRQVVSGIREYFDDIEVLLGRQCPFVTNLEPRMIKGLESQGMIVAAGGDESFALLHPGCEVLPGTRVV